jgi:hypothetical protein
MKEMQQGCVSERLANGMVRERGGAMLDLECGDRIELFYEDAPEKTIRGTIARVLTDREEGMGIEVDDYVVGWAEITVEEPSDGPSKQVVLLGTDFQCRLDGRRVTLRKSNG